MTDRVIVNPGQIPLDTDLLSTAKHNMVALGFALRATMGISTFADGLSCIPTVPATMSVTVGPGSLGTLSVVDANAYGSIPADASDPLVKLGINLTPTSFSLTPPATSGQSIAYLIEAAFSEIDANPIVLPYYNAANPAQPYAGPSNTGVPQNTVRQQRVTLRLSPGAPAPTGTQVPPATDSGYFPLWDISVAFGQLTVVATNIVQHSLAPFIALKLPAIPSYLATNYLPRAATTGTEVQTIFTPVSGSLTRTNALAFTASVPGIVRAQGSINLGAPGQQPSGCSHQVAINGTIVSTDNTAGSMTNAGSLNVTAGTRVTIQQNYAAPTGVTGFVSTSMWLDYMFWPT